MGCLSTPWVWGPGPRETVSLLLIPTLTSGHPQIIPSLRYLTCRGLGVLVLRGLQQ